MTKEKQRGFFATENIPRGAELLREEPVFVFPGSIQATERAVESFANLDEASRGHVLESFSFPLQLPEEATTASSLVEDMCKLRNRALSVHECSKLAKILVSNAHSCGKAGDRTGLFPLGSIFNHSCLANNVRLRPGIGDERVWYAGEEIAKGQELTACYLDQCSPVLLMSSSWRRHYLRATKLFDCICDACLEEPLDQYPCQKCGYLFVPPGGGVCCICTHHMTEEEYQVLKEGEWKMFRLLVEERWRYLNDESCVELLKETKKRYGEQHWPAKALALSLLSRPKLVVALSDMIGPLLLVRKGARRISQAVLSASVHHMEQVIIAGQARAHALMALSWLQPALERCVALEAFRSDRDIADAKEWLGLMKKTLYYAVDPENREACCVACAIAVQK